MHEESFKYINKIYKCILNEQCKSVIYDLAYRELNEILLWRMITEVRKELEYLKRSFENL